MSNHPYIVSRRSVLGAGLALGGTGLGGLLTACASGTSNASGSNASGSNKVGGTLVFAGFQGYDALQPTSSWRSAHHVNLHSIYVSDNNEIGTKVVAAERTGLQIDFIVYQQGFTSAFEQEKILQPIDISQIPNYKGLDPFFRSKYKK